MSVCLSMCLGVCYACVYVCKTSLYVCEYINVCVCAHHEHRSCDRVERLADGDEGEGQVRSRKEDRDQPDARPAQAQERAGQHCGWEGGGEWSGGCVYVVVRDCVCVVCV